MTSPPAHEPLAQCPDCGCRDMFVRKDFPQKFGMALVVLAGVAFLWLASSRSRFYLGAAILVAAAGVDAVLYWLVGWVTVCYRCRHEFRGGPLNPKHEGFELAV